MKAGPLIHVYIEKENSMSNKIIVIISTSDAGKARTGVANAMNALKNDWMDEVKAIFFGPADALLVKDADIQRMLKEYQLMDVAVVACKAVAEREGISGELAAMEVNVEFVGKIISDLFKMAIYQLCGKSVYD